MSAHGTSGRNDPSHIVAAGDVVETSTHSKYALRVTGASTELTSAVPLSWEAMRGRSVW